MPRFLAISLLALLVGPAPHGSAQVQSVDLFVAATTDVHGWLRGWDYYANAPDSTRGLARAATIVDSLRDVHPGRVLLVDGGDLLQGNPLAYVASRAPREQSPIVAAMNAMRYDAAAIGNHEFNYGLPLLDRAIAQARFPFLSTNSYRPSGARAYRGWRIVRRAGVSIALIGATTPGANVWDRDNLRGRLIVRDIVPEVRSAVRAARGRGVDVVIVVVHSGLDGASSYDTVTTGLPSENVSARLAREIEGIDLIVYGHSHRQMADTTIGSTMLMQPRNWAGSVAVASLRVEREGARWRVRAARGQLLPVAGRAESPRVLAASQLAHERTVSYVSTPLGTTPVAWHADSARVTDTPLIDFILEVERAAAKADLASTAAFNLDAKLGPGPITVAQLAKLYPYDNTLRAVRITGAQLRSYLEHSAGYFGTHGTDELAVDPGVPGYNFDIIAGATYAIDVSKPVGSRISGLTVKGRPVHDQDSFTLALNNYRASGGGGYAMLEDAPVIYETTQDIRQLLIDEVRRRGTLDPSRYFNRNWELIPPAAVTRAHEAMWRRASTSPR